MHLHSFKTVGPWKAYSPPAITALVLAAVFVWWFLDHRRVAATHVVDELRTEARTVASTIECSYAGQLRRGLVDRRALLHMLEDIARSERVRALSLEIDGTRLIAGTPAPGHELPSGCDELHDGGYFSLRHPFAEPEEPGHLVAMDFHREVLKFVRTRMNGFPDGDGDGRLTPREIREALESEDLRLSLPEELEGRVSAVFSAELIARLDLDGDGGIDAEEWSRPIGTGALAGRPELTVTLQAGGILRHISSPWVGALLLGIGLGIVALLTTLWVLVIRGLRLSSRLQASRLRAEHLEHLGLAAIGLAHETKNPLGIIRGLGQRIAADAEDPKKVQESALRIQEEVDRTASRLGDFMAYANLRSPRLEAIEASPFLEELGALLGDRFSASGVPMSVRSEALTIQADPELLKQVLVNLLLNALQASVSDGAARDRGVDLVCESTRSGARVTVRDRGAGIPRERLGEVVKPYVSFRPGGHGIGLALVQRICEAHGWQFSLESAPGRGTTAAIGAIELLEEKHP